MSKDDKSFYAVVVYENKKKLGKVLSKELSKYKVKIDEEIVNIEPKNILAKLARKPTSGSVYGVKVEPLTGTIEDDYWGNIKIFGFHDTVKLERLSKSLRIVKKFLDKQGLEKPDVYMELRPSSGSYSGYYRGGKEPTICLKPKEEEQAVYVVLHELGHAFWDQFLTSKYKGKWVNLYAKGIEKMTLAKKYMEIQRNYLKKCISLDDLIEFVDSSEDEHHKEAFDLTLNHIQKTYNLNERHINYLLEDNYQALELLWPVNPLDTAEVLPVISKYGSKNPEEFFAEAIAFYFTPGMELPDNIRSAVTKTLEKIK